MQGNTLAIELIAYLSSHSERKNAQGILSLFKNFANGGRDELTPSQFHPASNKDPNIYRFSKGKIRIYCFFDGPNIIIGTHGAMKKSQSTAQADLDKANAVRSCYLTAKAAGTLTIKTTKKPGES